MSRAYATSSAAWARGPERVYHRMAEALVLHTSMPLSGRLVLDLGAGTGAVSRVAAAAGARVIAVDLALEMLRHRRDQRAPALVADAVALPLRDSVIDVVISGFSVSHVPEPRRALDEARRVTRPGGAVMVAVFAGDGRRHPSREQIDGLAALRGYQAPAWHRRLKDVVEPLTASPTRLERLAGAAGLVDVGVSALSIDTGVHRPADIVDYRLGMAHLAPFVAGLSTDDAHALREEALAAVGPTPEPVVADVLILSSRVAA
ncbi:MAG: class I SAM-dependent methyltransferase [Candidatus Dormibacteria bacterium]